MIYLSYLVLGAIAGLFSGLFGIGGGIVIVPVLFYAFTAIGFPEPLVMQMALGTSLATIILTSFFAARAHNKRENLMWPVLWKMVPGLLVGSMMGGVLAHQLSVNVLKLGFGLFLLLISLQMWFKLKVKAEGNIPSSPIMFAISTFFGGISALFGIGGGSLVVPLLTWCRLPMRQAVGTASATGLAVAVTGSISFLLTGLQVESLPEWSLGYIYLPAFFGIIITSTQFVRLGAALASKISPILLKRGFSLFLLCVSAKLILS